MDESMTVSMDSLRRVLRMLALVGAGVLVVSLFMDWFELSSGDQTVSFSGWDAFEFADAAFVLIFLVAAGVAVAPIAADEEARLPALTRLAIASVVIVIIAVASSAPILKLAESSGDASIGLAGGAYVGIVGAILMALAGAADLALRRERRQAPPASGASTV